MTQLATVVNVMIASPSDIPAARDAVERALRSWNSANTPGRGFVLHPLRWETDSVPMLGHHPQAILNEQLLAKADIVIALFGSRVGSETPNSISGTVEEIEGAVASGKPVHLFFSEAPHPANVDLTQLQALRGFRAALQERGLYGSFENEDELLTKVWSAIEMDLRDIIQPLHAAASLPTPPSERFLVQGRSEREPKTDSKGRVHYDTRRWVEITNRGNDDVIEVMLEGVSEQMLLPGWDRPRTVHAGQKQTASYWLGMGGGEPRVKLTWVENGEPKSKEYDI
ncbi:DUF4062 domain-containing protein [Microbacterium sp. NPDC058342]|uniref:DUF4062 domain-containing protein n=1 Tax=Microbacterium sp. NPDC058342 TaxID=3346454 RepID=UPI00364C9542